MALCLLGCASEPAHHGMRLPPDKGSSAKPEVERARAELAAAALAPRPYTSEQIRAAMPVGYTTRYLAQVADRPPVLSFTRVLASDANSVTLREWQTDAEGQPLGPPIDSVQSWDSLRDHATFAAAETSIEDVDLETPAGRFACKLYTVTTTAGGRRVVSRFYFAVDQPGAPVRYERVENGQRAFQLSLQFAGVENAPDEP